MTLLGSVCPQNRPAGICTADNGQNGFPALPFQIWRDQVSNKHSGRLVQVLEVRHSTAARGGWGPHGGGEAGGRPGFSGGIFRLTGPEALSGAKHAAGCPLPLG